MDPCRACTGGKITIRAETLGIDDATVYILLPFPLPHAVGNATVHAMSTIRNVCVYCGSSPGTDPRFVEAAVAFGALLARSKIGLVYGGGTVGLMGAIASAVLAKGGNVVGVIPEFLASREHVNREVSELIVTRDMHERKRIMFERSDAFVALPGGIGTLEELVEQLTWAQLGRHRKPILAANIGGFWDPLCVLLDHMNSLAFIHTASLVNLLVVDTVDDILPRLRAAARPVAEAEKFMQAGTAERM